MHRFISINCGITVWIVLQKVFPSSITSYRVEYYSSFQIKSYELRWHSFPHRIQSSCRHHFMSRIHFFVQISSHDSSTGKCLISNHSWHDNQLRVESFCSWLSALINKSHRQGTLNLPDLYQLPEDLNSTLATNRLEVNWFEEIKHSPENPSLIRATLRTIGWKPFLLGFLLFVDVGKTVVLEKNRTLLSSSRDYFVLLNHYY